MVPARSKVRTGEGDVKAKSLVCGLGMLLVSVASASADNGKARPVSLHMRPRVAQQVAPDQAPDRSLTPAAASPSTAGPTDPSSASPPPEATPSRPLIDVTGSRIARDTHMTPAPLRVLSRDDLDAYGRSTLGDILVQLPMRTSATDEQVNTFGARVDNGNGALGVDLRGLGTNRTLILLDGRAIVPDGTGVVDVSMIPLVAVERVEILAPGGSAVYGSGAIGGVVNIITRSEFEGVATTLYAGDSQRGDGVTYDASFIVGHHTEDKRGSILLSAGLQHQDPVFANDRSFSSNPVFATKLAGELQPLSSRGTVYSAGSYRLRPEISGFFEASYLHHRRLEQFDPDSLGTELVSKDSLYNTTGTDVIDASGHGGLLGSRQTTQRTDLLRIVGGFRGTVPDDAPLLASWAWELSYNYGRIHVATDQRGELVPDRLAAAIGPSFRDANGVPTCGTPAAPLAGCVPLDLLGLAGPIDPAALAYIAFNGAQDEVNAQHTVLATAHGRLAELGIHGDLSAAAGADFHEESGQLAVDPTISTVDPANQPPPHGSYHLLEGFGELSFVPVRETAFVDRLELDLAARGFQSSALGGGVSWSAGGLFRTIGGLAVRGTYATTFRAPTIAELFQPRSEGAVRLTDPCDTSNGTNIPNIAQECMREGVPTNAVFGAQQRTVGGGNRGLEAETANVLTVGLMFEPPKLKGLELSVDYWSIELSNAVQLDPVFEILLYCYNLGRGSFCDRVHRNPAQGGAIDFIDVSLLNTGRVSTSGVDAIARFDHDFGALGRFHEQLEAQFLQNYDMEQVFVVTDRPYPDLQASLSSRWSHGSGLAGGVNLRYLDGFQKCVLPACGALLARAVSAWYGLDLNASYTFNGWHGRPTLAAGVNNLLDRAPPVSYVARQIGVAPSTYDLVGRFFYLRLSSQF